MSSYINYSEIFNNIDFIERGDIVYVISDIFNLVKIYREDFDVNVFLESLMTKVGKEGTILIPTFNWDFCQGKVFDYTKTKSQVGALGNASLRRKDYKRTKHPIYSFCIWGRDKKKLCGIDPKNSFGKGTVFEYLIENDAKALIIDLPTMQGMTILHHVEQMIGVPFRFEKEFTAGYIDCEGEFSESTYSMYVRDYSFNAEENTMPMNHILESLNISETAFINGIPFRGVRLREMALILEMDIKYNNCRNIYTYSGQKRRKVLTEKYIW